MMSSRRHKMIPCHSLASRKARNTDKYYKRNAKKKQEADICLNCDREECTSKCKYWK